MPRTDIVTGHIFNRLSFYGAKGALLENFTTFFGPTWLYTYRDFPHNAPLEGNQEVTFQFTLRGGWQLSSLVQRAFTAPSIPSPTPASRPPRACRSCRHRLNNLYTDQFSVTTPTYQTFNASASYAFGDVPLYAEGSEGKGTSISASLNLRPTTTLRFEGSVAYPRSTGRPTGRSSPTA